MARAVITGLDTKFQSIDDLRGEKCGISRNGRCASLPEAHPNDAITRADVASRRVPFLQRLAGWSPPFRVSRSVRTGTD